jgi:hypothetical protein
MSFDIDLDFGDRDSALLHIDYTMAMMEKDGKNVKHNSGIYVTAIPKNPITNISTLEYNAAEELGYFKLDFLNNSIYNLVRDRQQLGELTRREPKWEALSDKNFVQKLVHIGNHYDSLIRLQEPINSLEKMAMFLALIRPGKRHLIGRSWHEIENEIWEQNAEGLYQFKKAHSFSYSLLVMIHMNLLHDN